MLDDRQSNAGIGNAYRSGISSDKIVSQAIVDAMKSGIGEFNAYGFVPTSK